MESASTWVAKNFNDPKLIHIDRTIEDFLVFEDGNGLRLLVAVLGIRNVINISDVQQLFLSNNKPQLIINIPSKTLWSGAAIDFIHSQQSAFGSMGDISLAAKSNPVGSYRDKNMGYFITSMKQHGNVLNVSYIYDSVFQAKRRVGKDLIVAVINAYNMSAEDVRNTKNRIGQFDVVVKSTSYGSITDQAKEAAESMGAHALTFKELMQCLAK